MPLDDQFDNNAADFREIVTAPQPGPVKEADFASSGESKPQPHKRLYAALIITGAALALLYFAYLVLFRPPNPQLPPRYGTPAVIKAK